MRASLSHILVLLLTATVAISGVSSAAPTPTIVKLKPAAMPIVPAPIAVLAMVRSTLLSVDQANKTGNYTVLRDLAGAQFREANNASRLAQIFSPLASQGIDLLPVAIIDPDYKALPRITPTRMLYVTGTFPIRPRPVNFEILYEMSGGQWRVFGISIAPAE